MAEKSADPETDPRRLANYKPASWKAGIAMASAILMLAGAASTTFKLKEALGRWAFLVGLAALLAVVVFSINAHERAEKKKPKPKSPQQAAHDQLTATAEAIRGVLKEAQDLIERVPEEMNAIWNTEESNLQDSRCRAWRSSALRCRSNIERFANILPPEFRSSLSHPRKKQADGRKPNTHYPQGEHWRAQVDLFEAEQGAIECLAELDDALRRPIPRSARP
jgi:hypothetical protein